MSGRPLTTTFISACACLMGQAVAGCIASHPSPKPRAGAAAVVLEVTAQPTKGAKANRVARVPVYDAAPRPAAPSGQFELVDYSALDDVIVWLEPAGGADATASADSAGDGGDAGDLTPDAAARPTAPPPPPPPLAFNVAARVHPDDVRAVTVGQEVVFRNGGAESVSLYSVSEDNDFDLPDVPPGGEARYTIGEAGLIEVLADPSDPPVATLYAVASPWVARTRSGGRVVFDDVTPGSYEAVSWHPRLPGSTAPLSLAPGDVARPALRVGVNVLADDQP